MQPVHDETADLARKLGMPVDAFAEIFGAEWRLNDAEPDHDFDADPSGGMGMDVTPWMLAGDPPQLMIRVFDHGVFVAAPEGRWSGHRLEYQPATQEYVRLDHLVDRGPDVVAGMLRSRRRQFSYCRYCRQHTPVELRDFKDVCMACASRWHGVVH